MVWRNLLLAIISYFSVSSFVFCQNETVYDEQGKSRPIRSVFGDSGSFVIIKDAFCIGCVEYLVNSSESKKVLVVVEGFSLLYIINFQPIKNAELFFISNSEVQFEYIGTVGVGVVQGDSLRIINEIRINELTNFYQNKEKTTQKNINNYFKTKKD